MRYILENDLTLLEASKQCFPDSSHRTLLNWIKFGRVMVDNRTVKRANTLIKKGQSLLFKRKALTQTVEGIPLLYQDRWVMVIDKPMGLLSVPAENGAKPNALHLLRRGLKSSSIFPVHRIDQETSGVLLFARSKISEEKFDVMFEKHDLEREYLAIVEGHFPEKCGIWEDYLREKKNFDVEVTSPRFGHRAVTHFEVIKCSKKFSYLRLRLETGKKHQIRVQAAERGYPLVGDARYGSLIDPFKRLCLHAHRLSFIHPFTKKKMLFTCDCDLFSGFTSESERIRKVLAIPLPSSV